MERSPGSFRQEGGIRCGSLWLGVAAVSLLTACETDALRSTLAQEDAAPAGNVELVPEPPAEERPDPELDPVRDPDSASRREACYPGKDRQNCIAIRFLPSLSPAERVEFTYRNPSSDSSFPKGLDPDQYRVPTYFVPYGSGTATTDLSRNFQLAEFLSPRTHVNGSYTFLRFGIIQRKLIEALQIIRDRVGAGVRVNSAYRSPGYNRYLRDVKGLAAATWSRHMYGDAVDIASSSASVSTLARYCRELKADFVQLYTNHVHCDWRNRPLDEAFFPRNGIDTPLALFSREERNLRFQSAIAEEARISLIAERGLNVGSSVRLSLESVYQEDEGDLLVSWKVVTPQERSFDAQAQEISFELEEPGTYRVTADVGGMMLLMREFEVR